MSVLYTRHNYPNLPAPVATRDLLYCSISESLKSAAVAALNAFTWLREEMETLERRNDCQLRYPSRSVAEQRAKHLRDLRLQKLNGVERPPDDTVYRELLSGDTTWLGCSVSEFLAVETDFDKLAMDIRDAKEGTTLPSEKRLKKLAQAYLTLFDKVEEVDPIAAYGEGEVTPEVQKWGQMVIQQHMDVITFLRLFVSRCASEKPEETQTEEFSHAVVIQDLSRLVVDGEELKMNSARKAALFSLAVLGTDVSDKEFALLYNDDLYRNPDRAAKYGNIVSQALDGLKKSLPHLHVTKPRSHYTSVHGVEITTEVSNDDLKKWLHGRTSRGDELLGLHPENFNDVLLRVRALSR